MKEQHQTEDAIVKKVSVTTIAGNTFLSAAKLAAGLTGHSAAMISDSIHSMSDVFTTIIAAIGVRISKKPADTDHPYGHERYETLASLFLAIILAFTGLAIGKAGIETIVTGEYKALAVPGTIALYAAILSILVKEAMYWYTRHYANIIHSQAFLADAWHHRSDALSSIGSLIGIAGSRMGFPILDPAASVLICLFILKASWDILKNAVSNTMDTSCGQEFDQELADLVLHHPDVLAIDSIKSRAFGNKAYVDLEIAVDGNKPLHQAHAIAQQVHDTVETARPEVKHIMIHVNPAQTTQLQKAD